MSAGPDTARAAVLGRVRAALARGPDADATARATVEARLAQPSPNLVPARGRLDPAGRVALFTTMARAVQAEVEPVAQLTDVPAAVAYYLRRHNLPQRLVAAPHPMIDAAGLETQPLLRARRGTAVDDDAVGLTVAPAGVAETGTLVLTSSDDTPTLLAFLPETSIVLVAADAIVGSYEDAWALLRRDPGHPPRSVNLITGPSRTGDIAQTIELGAHGPRRLLILVIGPLPGAAGEAVA